MCVWDGVCANSMHNVRHVGETENSYLYAVRKANVLVDVVLRRVQSRVSLYAA